MAEHVTSETYPWHLFVDRVAAALRLETPERMCFGLVASLTVVRELWGEIVFLRAAERLVATHAFVLDDLMAPRDGVELRAWFGAWLAAHAPPHSADAAQLQAITKPAYQPPRTETEAQR